MAINNHPTPHFSKSEMDNKHFTQMRKLVYETVHKLPPSIHKIAVFKAIMLPALYLFIYILALLANNYFLFCSMYFFLGIFVVVMFLNLIHEACHTNLFKSKKLNHAYMYVFDLIGANSYMWAKRHLRLHHNFTNVVGWDSDIEKSKFLKVHPEDNEKLFSKYQHLLVLLYPLFITNWFLIRDFKDFFNNKTIVRKIEQIPIIEYVKLFFFKLFFVGYLLVLPSIITPFTFAQTLLALFIMLLTAGLYALVVLLPPHVNTSNQFPVVDDKLNLEQSWLSHQLNTTNDVNESNWFTKHVMANFNFHIAHHLFPNLSYVYAKEVTDVIRNYNQQNGLPYRTYNLATTFKNHYKLIKRNRHLLKVLNEDM